MSGNLNKRLEALERLAAAHAGVNGKGYEPWCPTPDQAEAIFNILVDLGVAEAVIADRLEVDGDEQT